MAESNDRARAAYLRWLKDEVERWCNEEGFFEAESSREAADSLSAERTSEEPNRDAPAIE